jgi:hypothetical protein
MLVLLVLVRWPRSYVLERQAKVYQVNLGLAGIRSFQNVLQLKVPVHVVNAVQHSDAFQDLHHNFVTNQRLELSGSGGLFSITEVATQTLHQKLVLRVVAPGAV